MGMNPEVKAQWLHALRSGDWLQGEGWLRTPEDQYCCLGVLCELAHQAGTTEYWEQSRAGGPNYHKYGAREIGGLTIGLPTSSWSTLPPNVMTWAGLDTDPDDHDPYVRISERHPRYGALTGLATTPEGKKARLSQLNDVGWTFEEIADMIEEQL